MVVPHFDALDWEAFKELVKHQKRYFFHHELLNEKPGNYASYIVEKIGEELCYSSRTLSAGTSFFRSRSNPKAFCGDDLIRVYGPPPRDSASENRMSPAGISMFYVADSPEVAVAEVAYRDGEFGVAEFQLDRNSTILDLADLTGIKDQSVVDFLTAFVADATRPVVKDQLRHIDYVPTQIFTETISRNWSDDRQNHIDGIRFPSASKMSGNSFVFFFDDVAFVEGNHPFKFVGAQNYDVRLMPELIKADNAEHYPA